MRKSGGANSPNITLKELNRATLARQMLLEREPVTALTAIENLAGLQAQQARPPFVGLWARVANFRPQELAQLLAERKVVRATMMRGTLHLVSSKDYLALRGALQPGLTAGMNSILRDRARALDMDQLMANAGRFFGTEPHTFDDLRKAYIAEDATCDERAMAYAIRTHLPLVQVPDDSRWCFPASAGFLAADAWLKKPVPGDQNSEELVLRYLAAFGPATVADAQCWSGLKGLQGVFDALAPKLLVLTDERGRKLFDIPDAPRPSAEVPAPARFLPDFDNLLLAHADRTRIITDEHRKRVVTTNLQVLPTFMVDGMVAGIWKVEIKKQTARLNVQPFMPLDQGATAELEAEGKTLLKFLEPDATILQVRFA